MSPGVYLALPYAIAALPLVLVAAASTAWWGTLARPWLYVLLGSLALYGVVVIAVLVASQFVTGGYFLEVRAPGSSEQPATDPLTVVVIASVAAFIAVGGGLCSGGSRYG